MNRGTLLYHSILHAPYSVILMAYFVVSYLLMKTGVDASVVILLGFIVLLIGAIKATVVAKSGVGILVRICLLALAAIAFGGALLTQLQK